MSTRITHPSLAAFQGAMRQSSSAPRKSFRANLIERKLGDKSINNVLADLSKPLHYAADVELIPKAFVRRLTTLSVPTTLVASVRTQADDVVGADDPGRQRRLEWAVLLKRAYAIDVLTCPRCQGPMRLLSVIQDERVARRILEHLGLPARAPPRGGPWWSGQQLALDDPDRYDGIDEPVLN